MADISIEFTTPRGKILPIFSWLIRVVQGTPYSHVLLRWTNSTGVDIVYEASGQMLKFLGPEATKNRYTIHKRYKTELTREQYKELIKLCMTNAGLDYGVKQILGICLVYLFKLKKNPFADGRKSQVCSEIVGRFLEQVLGWQLDLDLDIAGPKQIDDYLSSKLKTTGELLV